MAEIKHIEGLTIDDISSEVAQGGRFVVFQYCISIIFMTFKRSSDIYFIRHTEGTTSHGIPYTLLSLVMGWWGFPWGPIYTISSVANNFSGGKNVTTEVMNHLNRAPRTNVTTVNPVQNIQP